MRTPAHALAETVPVDGQPVPMMAELFATTADVYRLTGELDERYDQHEAADGGPKTREASARRLARLVGRDAHERPLATWIHLARALREEQLTRIVRACLRIESRIELMATAPVVLAGCGAFLGAEVVRRLGRAGAPFGSLLEGDPVDPTEIAQAAPALAVALLALDPQFSS